jgi:hypothetical protein
MESEAKIRWFKHGLYFCWAGIVAAPAAWTHLLWGPCGPGTATMADSIFVLIWGLCPIAGTGIGAAGMVRGMKFVNPARKVWAVFSMLVACVAALLALLFVFVTSQELRFQ